MILLRLSKINRSFKAISLLLIWLSLTSAQRVLKQIQPAGVGYLINYNMNVEKCLEKPYVCNSYDTSDVTCMNGVAQFQNCLAQNCFPIQFYDSYPYHEQDYLTYGKYLLACAKNCEQQVLAEKKSAKSATLVLSLNQLIICYQSAAKDVVVVDYYSYFFEKIYSQCVKENKQDCKSDQVFSANSQQVQTFVQNCVKEIPIYAYNTVFVSGVAFNQTSTCLFNAFTSYSIDYNHDKCFSDIVYCAGFSILQPMLAKTIQFSIFLTFFLILSL